MIIPPSPVPWPLALGTSSSGNVPAPSASSSACKSLFTLEWRHARYFHLSSKWKRKRRRRSTREEKLASNGKTRLSRFASKWMQRAKKTGDVGAGLTDMNQTTPRASLKTKGMWEGAGVMKCLLESSISSRNSTSFSSTRKDESKLSFTQTFNPITDEDASSSTYTGSSEEASSDFSFDYTHKPRIGKWGYWNNPDYMISNSTHESQSGKVDERPVVEKTVMSGEGFHGLSKRMSWASIQNRFSKLGKKRSHITCGTGSHHVVNSVKKVHIGKNRKRATDATCKTQKKEPASCVERRKCYKSTSSGDSKLGTGRKGSFSKQVTTASDVKIFAKEKSSDLLPAHDVEKITNKEKLKGTSSSQLLDRLSVPFVRNIVSKRGHGGLKSQHNKHNEAASSSTLVQRRAILPGGGMPLSKSIRMFSSEINDLYSAESVTSTGKATGIFEAVNTNRTPTKNVYPVSSGNDHFFTDISSSLSSNAMQTSLHETNWSCRKLGLLLTTTKGHKKRSALTVEGATFGHTADLVVSSNAKMDTRAKHVLTPTDVDNQVEEHAHSQPQTSIVVDDEEESVHSRLISSSSSDLGTLEMELSPLKNCVSILQLPNDPIVKEFKEAVDAAHFKTRVLAALLTVEKGARMASARDFQSKRTILSMGIMGAQMVEGELSLKKPWHFKYLLDYCVTSIFFNGPHSSSHCICSRQSFFASDHKSGIYDSFCNDMNFVAVTFESFCDEATRAVEELVGRKAKAWSDTLTNMFWNCAVCCFQVHKLIVAIQKRKRTMQILHPHRGTSFDVSSMDPLDTGDFNGFHKKVLFTIFSGFMLEGKVLCKSQVYLEPRAAAITL